MPAHAIAPRNGQRIQRQATTSKPITSTLSVTRARSGEGGVRIIERGMISRLARRRRCLILAVTDRRCDTTVAPLRFVVLTARSF
jgi:hypothetical protein